MAYVGTGSVEGIRRAVYTNAYRDTTASPKPTNAGGMNYRDTHDRAIQDHNRMNASKIHPSKTTSYYSKVRDSAKSQQGSPLNLYLDDDADRDDRDDRVHNDLLEEIFNVQDSISLDYFELERQAIDPYPVELGVGLTRLTADFEQTDQVIHFATHEAEEEGYRLHELQSRKGGCDFNVHKGPRKTVGYEKPGSEIIAVASPTISSTCETMTGSSGAVKSQSQPDSTSSGGIDGVTTAGVDSTTSSVHGTRCSGGSDDPRSGGITVDGRQNVRPRAEHVSRSNRAGENISNNSSGVASHIVKGQINAIASGESTATSSTSTSPSQIQVKKKPRTIESGTDLVADVRDTYEYVRGANLFAPSFHPTFSSFSSDTNQVATFQGSEQHFTSHNASGRANSRNVISRPSGSECWDPRCTASPGNIHMSCPNLASPVCRSPALPHTAECVPQGASSAYPAQRVGLYQQQSAYNDSMTSLSAPSTPSKQRPTAHFNQTREHSMRSPMASFAGQQVSNLSGNRPVGQGMGQSFAKHAEFGNIVRQQDMQGRSWSPSHRNMNTCQPPQLRNRSGQLAPHQIALSQNGESSSFGSGQQPVGNVSRSASGMPLSENAFLHGLINDKSSAFRSHRLFPLLRDIIIADMNFHTPSFPFQLICNLPTDFNHLTQNYVSRNPHLAKVSAGDAAIETVFMDALAYAHSTLIEKIHMRKVSEGLPEHSSSNGIEDFCETFERTVNPVVNEYGGEILSANPYERNGVAGNTYSDLFIQDRPSTPTMNRQQQHAYAAPATPQGSTAQHLGYSGPSTPRGRSVQQPPDYSRPSTPRGSSIQQPCYAASSTPQGSHQPGYAAPLTPRGSQVHQQQSGYPGSSTTQASHQPGYAAPLTPRGSQVHQQHQPGYPASVTPRAVHQDYGAPVTPRGSNMYHQDFSGQPLSNQSTMMQRNQHVPLASTFGCVGNEQQETYLTGSVSGGDQRPANYSYSASMPQMNVSTHQRDMAAGTNYHDCSTRYQDVIGPPSQPGGPISHHQDLRPGVPPSRPVSINQELNAPPGPSMYMSHEQARMTAFNPSSSVRHLVHGSMPIQYGSLGQLEDRLSPTLSSGSSGQYPDLMPPMNPPSQHHLMSNRIGSTNQLSDGLFLSRPSSSGRYVNRNIDALDPYESARLDLDSPYHHDKIMLSRRQTNERLIHSLPTSPQKIMHSSMYMGNNGGYTNNEYNLEKTNKSKVLPKEAVAIMTDWLREHQDNPYPNDDEKEALIISTRLTINQINYWFTNARRRVLPKWALQRHLDEQEKSRRCKVEATS